MDHTGDGNPKEEMKKNERERRMRERGENEKMR